MQTYVENRKQHFAATLTQGKAAKAAAGDKIGNSWLANPSLLKPVCDSTQNEIKYVSYQRSITQGTARNGHMLQNV